MSREHVVSSNALKWLRLKPPLLRDYVHGPMNTIIYNLSNLHDDPQAALAFNCLVNVGVVKDDEEFFHTYVS